jgi:hypothetical protein
VEIKEDNHIDYNALAQVEIKLGSVPPTKIQRKLEDIFNGMSKAKSWDQAADEIIAQSSSFLKSTSPRPTDNVTLVTGVFDLGPDGAELDLSDVRALTSSFMQYPQSKLIFVDEQLLDIVLPYMVGNVKIVVLGAKRVKEYLSEPYKDIQRITKNRTWKYLVSWLEGTPQATVPEFTLLGMSRILFLREAARLNPFNTVSFLWLDPGMTCVPPAQLTHNKMGIFNELFDRFFIPYFPYISTIETHGFPTHTLNYFLNSTNKTHRVAKGWAMGGQPEYIEVLALVSDIVLRETLRQGQMGNADCLFTILIARFPALVHPLNMVNACENSKEYDKTCEKFDSPGGWCSVFKWAVEGPPKQ